MERTEDRLIFHAGTGEWYNQPHNESWDMGEDAADIPPAAWHVALEEAIEAQERYRGTVVVDVTEMLWLVGQDWGFLLQLSRHLTGRKLCLVVVGTEGVVRAGSTLELDERFELSTSLDDLLGTES